MESDAELIDQVLNGKRESFAPLVARYERLTLATVLRTLSDRHLAEDVLQESFVAAFRSLHKLRATSSFGPWLAGIARKQALKALRRQRAVVHVATSELSDVDGSSTLLPEDSMALLEIVDQLPDDCRTLIGLRHFEGYSMSEIAVITGSPLGTVTKKLSRIHKTLKEMISEEES